MRTLQAHQMKLIFVGAIAILIALLAVPLMAQDGGAVTYPANTITVTGSGSASGTPDIANLVIGVEIFNSDLAVAFDEANSRIDAIIAAVVEAGVNREDIRTMGLNVFIDRSFGPMAISPMESGMAQESPEQQQNYVVSNQLNLTVRDISKVADVINAGVEAGANNLFGLDFRIDDTAALESEARVEAMADARARAEHLAEIAGVTLGDAIVITEGGFGGFGPFPNVMNQDMAAGFGGGASVEPGRLSVSMAVTVTYTIAQ